MAWCLYCKRFDRWGSNRYRLLVNKLMNSFDNCLISEHQKYLTNQMGLYRSPDTKFIIRFVIEVRQIKTLRT
jgi:hypothetical protein